MAATGILALLLGLVMLILPVSRIPLLDANRTTLAESEREGYCSGTTYLETRGAGDAEVASGCRSTSSLPDQIDLDQVQPAFCRAIRQEINITQSNCMNIMAGSRYWPTKDGSIAYQWNRKFPYPGNMIVQQNSTDSRTGDREE